MVGSPENAPQPSNELRLGRRALEGVPGFGLTEDLRWHAGTGRWLLGCRLWANVVAGGPVPEETDWYILIHPEYEAGAIDFFPAAAGGLAGTFPHQKFNREQSGLPWRTGRLCLTTEHGSLRRQGFDSEPRRAADRLRWHVERALTWLSLASEGGLLQPGDFFELPDFPAKSEPLVVFAESAESLSSWSAGQERFGYVELSFLSCARAVLVAHRFEDRRGREIHSASWGPFVGVNGTRAPLGAWVHVDRPIALPPWQAPVTWGELKRHLLDQDCEIGKWLGMLTRLRDHHLPDEKRPRHPLLLGFPIPERVGEAPRRIHWMALSLPVLSAGERFASGFRQNGKGYQQRDARILNPRRSVEWLPSECWSEGELSDRGRLGAGLRSKSVVLIGAGALGSAVAELLVRGGIRSLTIVDPDHLEAGNLVRHTLTLREVGANKAEALALRLNGVSPGAVVNGHGRAFPNLLTDCEAADLIIDATGDDDVLLHLEKHAWRRDHWFVSLWVGMNARRAYCFAAHGQGFPAWRCLELFEPWHRREARESSGDSPRRPGLGCWHPTFPARADDVWLMGALLVKHFDRILEEGDVGEPLTVFEQHEGGVSKVTA